MSPEFNLQPIFRDADPCPDDFRFVATIQNVLGKTKNEAAKTLDAAIAAVLKQLEQALNCSQYQCKDDDKCEFDYVVETAFRKIFLPLKKCGKKKRRWLASATILAGCFCPCSGDDSENDPQ